MSKILLFQGDSITDCGRSSCGGAGYPTSYGLGPGYPGLIGAKLQGEQPEKDWKVINRGISGNRIVDLYARWKIDAVNHAPDIISILIGVNDTGHEISLKNGVEVPRYDKIYRRLLEWTLEVLPNTKFVLLEPFVIPFGAVTQEWVGEIDQRREVVRKIASDFHAVFVPLQSIFNEALKRAPQEYWIVDGIHPQPAGHQLIANAWLKAAADIL